MTPTFVTFSRRRPSRRAGRALRPLLHEVEGVHAGAELVAGDEVGEGLVLGGEALLARSPTSRPASRSSARYGDFGTVPIFDSSDLRAIADRRRPTSRRARACPARSAATTLIAPAMTPSAQRDRRPRGTSPRGRARRRCRGRGPAAAFSVRLFLSGFSTMTLSAFSMPIRFGSSSAPPQPGMMPRNTSGSAMAARRRVDRAVVGVQGDLEAAAEREPVDERERRHAEVVQLAERRVPEAGQLAARPRGSGICADLGEVGARRRGSTACR